MTNFEKIRSPRKHWASFFLRSLCWKDRGTRSSREIIALDAGA